MPLSVSLWNDLCDPAFDGVEQADFKNRANAFLAVGLICSFILSPNICHFSSLHWLVVLGLVFGLIEYSHSLPTWHCRLNFNNNNKNNNNN